MKVKNVIIDISKYGRILECVTLYAEEIMTERQANILRIVNENSRVDVAVLARMLNVSQVTVRKDLDVLEERGLLVREHGYAQACNSDDINKRLAVRYDVKLRIARAAAEIVANGETVMIESGSSCAILAEILANEKKDVTIITNSAFIASHLRDAAASKVVLLGGDYQKESQVMVGPLVRKCAREFYVDKLFMGTDGFIPQAGFTCGDMMRAEAMKNMAESAKHSIILTDSTKFNQQGVVLQCRFENVQMVFTDDGISEQASAILMDHNIALTVS